MVKPILFNTEMVRAILDGRKTVTRRVVKPQPNGTLDQRWGGFYEDNEWILLKEPYRPGDVLWVRETWGDYRECEAGGCGYFLYRSDYPDGATTYQHPDGQLCDLPTWRPSIHMPREAARIFLRVTDVRVERLQEIDGDGLMAEGFDIPYFPNELDNQFNKYGAIFDFEQAKKSFSALWDSTIKPAAREKYGWAANPFCWVIEFERCEKPEEA